MDNKRPPFNWSDAWLLLAISVASHPGPANLEKVIATGDGINFALFTPDELESGLVRLTEAGYITEKSGSFSVTEKVQPHLQTLLATDRPGHERLLEAQEMLGAAAAVDDPPCRNNLRYPGFSQKQYEEAVQNYQGYLR